MPETSLVVVDPGHFHATLVQQQMYPQLSPVVRVYAPLGPDLIEFTLLRAYIEANRLQEAKGLLDVRRPGASGVPVMGIAAVH